MALNFCWVRPTIHRERTNPPRDHACGSSQNTASCTLRAILPWDRPAEQLQKWAFSCRYPLSPVRQTAPATLPYKQGACKYPRAMHGAQPTISIDPQREAPGTAGGYFGGGTKPRHPSTQAWPAGPPPLPHGTPMPGRIGRRWAGGAVQRRGLGLRCPRPRTRRFISRSRQPAFPTYGKPHRCRRSQQRCPRHGVPWM
jgi:hypothetical protein